MKLCKDCKYWMPSTLGAEYDKCSHPATQPPPKVDLVRGADGASGPQRFCDLARMVVVSPCGPDGKLWEARG